MSAVFLLALLAAAMAEPDQCNIRCNVYCNITSCPKVTAHIMCLYPSDNGAASSCGTVKERGVSANDQKEILRAHNTIRQDVKNGVYANENLPKAQMMPDLAWDDELATVAQRWADQCNNNDDKCHNVPRFPVGKSMLWQNGPDVNKNWSHVITDSWFLQRLSHFKEKQKDLTCCAGYAGRLTQIIWAATVRVGCGFIGAQSYQGGAATTTSTYICHYGPSGNIFGQQIYQKKP